MEAKRKAQQEKAEQKAQGAKKEKKMIRMVAWATHGNKCAPGVIQTSLMLVGAPSLYRRTGMLPGPCHISFVGHDPPGDAEASEAGSAAVAEGKAPEDQATPTRRKRGGQ